MHSINPKSSIRNTQYAIRNPVSQSSPESSSTPQFPNPKSKIQNRISRLRSIHSNQHGAISILTVFILLMFTMLLMMVFNVAKQHDDKLRMQNAADAAAYSGGVVLARGMNAIAFSNHLEADVFAITAFLREARDRNAAGYVPEVLSAWAAAGNKFSGATFPKFQGLDGAINRKVPLELEFVNAWSEMAAQAAQNMLPVFQYILGTPGSQAPGARDHLIPEFQRTIVQIVPSLAQEVTLEISLRHGLHQQQLDQLNVNVRDSQLAYSSQRGPQPGVLWTTSVVPVGYDAETDPNTRTLPVVDPEPYQTDYFAIPNAELYLQHAQARREYYAREYLRQWVADGTMEITRGLGFADEEAAMSQFARLFYNAACAQLLVLLDEEYPETNVPFILRDFQEWNTPAGQLEPTANQFALDRDYTFVGVAYRRHVELNAPRMFQNPLAQFADAQTYAQVSLFLPYRRYYKVDGSWYFVIVDRNGNPQPIPHSDNWSPEWSTFNQNWTCKLVPATTPALTDILASNPGSQIQGLRPSSLGSAYSQDVRAVNTH